MLVGVLVTGAGPHSGDAYSERNGLDLELLQHLHSYPGNFSRYQVLKEEQLAQEAVIQAGPAVPVTHSLRSGST